MKIAPVAEVKAKSSEFISECHKGTVVVTESRVHVFLAMRTTVDRWFAFSFSGSPRFPA